MMTTSDVARVYDTVLSIPGMQETVKIDLKITRKQVLLLAQVIERGLKPEAGEAAGLLAASGKEAVQELSAITGEFLAKAGLTELSAKLGSLQGK